ncbi:DUF1697 domain-containing protein [Sphingomonas sp. S1-29]|uniref:DUF1697 domain-containing protein n=1 Tax=Sphingomonas sp. S1-29 TaxID=2991074 RepID=UPI00223FEDFE|nr:DUF1697 domain-containing protein [Sphingomonas sp. S1-29]UZK68780.1 DUF1697 domain-containing protein [Sphingomonas sp. S1-29]
MSIWAALLRGVNIGGDTALPMTQLRQFLTDIGLSSVRTLLASGNAVFEVDGLDASAIEDLLEREAAARIQLRTNFLVRSDDDIADVATGNPFPDVGDTRPDQLVVAFGRVTAPVDVPQRLAAIYHGSERIEVRGREMYIDFPNGQGRSKLWPAVAKLKLNGIGTARNWNTVLKLHSAMPL